MTTVAVVGAGKMGLPIACHMASRGARVMACDVNEELVAKINRGESPIDEPGVPEALRAAVASGNLQATTDTAEAAAQSSVVIVIVPVLLEKHAVGYTADTTIMESALGLVLRSINPGTLVIVETTLPVGGTRRLAEELSPEGRKPGVDYHLVFSPERVKSLHVLERLDKTPKVIGGYSRECAAKAAAFYSKYLGAPVIDVGGLEAAEFTKLADMLYRDVNIALANELARYSESIGVDFGRVAKAANTSGEAHLLSPGVGVGGHCTPVYPWFAISDARARGMQLVLSEQARRINDTQAAHALDRLERAWGPLRGRNALILGLAFRPQVKEHICSPAFILREELVRCGANVRLHDPLYTAEEIRRHGFDPHLDVSEPWAEALILNTAHSEYHGINFIELHKGGLGAVLDGRNIWERQLVEDANLVYVGIGR